MKVREEIKEALRQMLLPVPTEVEENCVNAVFEILSATDIDQASFAQFIKLQFDIWRTEGRLHKTLRTVITTTLTLSSEKYGELFGNTFLDIQNSLFNNNPFINFDLSIILLSHLRLIASLAENEKMSAAKITKVLHSIDNRLSNISWKDIQTILRALRLLPQMNVEGVNIQYAIDENFEEECFADADMLDASFQVSELAQTLQFQGNIELLLNTLVDPDKVHLPYLQILHYQCLLTAFYDHSLTNPYEFNPRGRAAEDLFTRWNSLLHTSNPFLNNAKAVDVLDDNWARSRKPNEFETAAVLVKLLQGLETMGLTAARELTGWIRRWLVRYIRLNSVTVIPISKTISVKQRISVIEHIAAKTTATYGILEQRLVDAVVNSLYKKEDGWRSRGLGDSVNSNNLSRKKLGDCDFQHSTLKVVHAFEAHGGVLSKIYFQGHVRTFRRALESRQIELESIADLVEWNFKVSFVAYGFEQNLPSSFKIDKNIVDVEYLTFYQLNSMADLESKNFQSSFDLLFIDILNNRRTPSFVRSKINALLENG